MKETLKIAAVSLNSKYADVAHNISSAQYVVEQLNEIEEAPDIIVFPELFPTGFITDEDTFRRLAEPEDGPTMSSVKAWVKKYGCAIAGGYAAIDEKGEYYNRAFFISPESKPVYYNKRHLFSLSAESRIFAHGDSLPTIWEYHGWRISMIICYDLRFPVWCRSVRYSYDVMLVPANWPQARRHAWETLLAARAIENQAAYVGCDRGGADDFGVYDDLSMIMDAYGMRRDEIIMLPDGTNISIATLTTEHLKSCRRRLPTANDMDDFKLQCQSISKQ